MPWQQTTPFVACTLAMSPEPLLCTAGVGLACLTVWRLHRRCFHIIYSCLLGRHRFLALDWWLLHERHSGLWTNHRCSLGLHLATGCRGSACLGWGLLSGPLLGADSVGLASVGLTFFNAGSCTDAAALRDILVVESVAVGNGTGSFSACFSPRNA